MPSKSFIAVRGPSEDVGEHIELRPTDPVRGRSGQTILAFCLPLDEARELGRELLRLSGQDGHTCVVLGPCDGNCRT